MLSVGDFLVFGGNEEFEEKELPVVRVKSRSVKGYHGGRLNGFEECTLSVELAYLMGWLTGDGCLTNPNKVVFVTGNEEERVWLVSLVRAVFGKEFVEKKKKK